MLNKATLITFGVTVFAVIVGGIALQKFVMPMVNASKTTPPATA